MHGSRAHQVGEKTAFCLLSNSLLAVAVGANQDLPRQEDLEAFFPFFGKVSHMSHSRRGLCRAQSDERPGSFHGNSRPFFPAPAFVYDSLWIAIV